MKKVDEFILKDGRKVDIVLPTMDGLRAITEFVNKLSKEDTFLTFAGEEYSLAFEKNWLKNVLNEIKFNKNYILWVLYDRKIVGACNITKGGTRDGHVGSVGLMIDADFRRQGLGQFLLKKILQKGKESGLKITKLTVFDDNIGGKKLYEKMGFHECGRIKNGLYRKGKYVDDVVMYKNL